MNLTPIPREEIINESPVREEGAGVVYWMQHAQRAEDNHALEYAIAEGNRLGLPVAALFVLNPRYPLANLRHFTFMLEGLREAFRRLRARGVGVVTRLGAPVAEVLGAARELNAALLVTDRGYLTLQREWRRDIAAALPVRMVEVDTDCIIPCAAFPAEEYAAHTFRPKVQGLLPHFLQPVTPAKPRKRPPKLPRQDFDPEDIPATLRLLKVDSSVPPSVTYRGGAEAAEGLLRAFLRDTLPIYREKRQDAAANIGSHLSPYLHYGQISPLRVALEVMSLGADDLSMQSFLDELIVRRELSINFVWHNPHYATPDGWPGWARDSLAEHRADPRPARYAREQLAAAETDDPVWNAAQKELLASGEIHNYPRMLWAKRMLEWTASAEEAWGAAMWLNDWFALDGRDPNGYTNVAWCLGGKHDRPWPPHPIFGKVRMMSTARAGAHFNVRGYIARVNGLCARAGIASV